MAFVLPFEITHVRYARSLWRYLAMNFGGLRVVRSRQRFFPNLLQEAVLLFADSFGESTSHVQFEIFDGVWSQDARPVRRSISIDRITSGEMPFTRALLSDEVLSLLAERVEPNSVPLGKLAKFRVGYVSGDKRFFNPSPEDISTHGIEASSLLPAIASARALSRVASSTSELSDSEIDWLFSPTASDESELAPSEARYIEEGRRRGVTDRYKCRIRSPWWKVPGIRVPELLLPVFSDRPRMLFNDRGLTASNSFVCGYLTSDASPDQFVAAWNSPVTDLQIELNVHALGGGVFVLVPREVSSVRVPAQLSAIDVSKSKRQIQSSIGSLFGISDAECELLVAGALELREWRTASTA